MSFGQRRRRGGVCFRVAGGVEYSVAVADLGGTGVVLHQSIADVRAAPMESQLIEVVLAVGMIGYAQFSPVTAGAPIQHNVAGVVFLQCAVSNAQQIQIPSPVAIVKGLVNFIPDLPTVDQGQIL